MSVDDYILGGGLWTLILSLIVIAIISSGWQHEEKLKRIEAFEQLCAHSQACGPLTAELFDR